MNALEFDATINAAGQILLPENLMGTIPTSGAVHVVLTWDSSSADPCWLESGRRRFEESYCEADAIYEQLISDDTATR